MKKSTKTFFAAAALAAAPVALAAPINVGGVLLDPDSPFNFSATDTMIETAVFSVGDLFSGYGKFTMFNGEATQNDFCPGCELTYEFYDYELAAIDSNGRFAFTGGKIDVYVDHSPNYHTSNPDGATEGVLFLSLEGATHQNLDNGLFGTLFSDATPAAVNVQGSGKAYLNVTGGLAAAYFDTNTFGMDGTSEMADFIFTSSFQLLPNSPIVGSDGRVYPLFGSNDISGKIQNIPEPASLALLGLGLTGLGLASRRRKKT